MKIGMSRNRLPAPALRHLKKCLVGVVLTSLFFSCDKAITEVDIVGEEGHLKAHVQVGATGKLSYSILYDNDSLLLRAPLGIRIDSLDLGTQVEIIGIRQNSAEGSYPFIGIQDSLYERYREKRIGLRDLISGTDFSLEVRNYDNAIAFRYHLPLIGKPTVKNENTSFRLPNGTKAWYASGPFQYGWLQAFQDRKTDDIKGELLAPPATFQLPNNDYISITEASLYNYHGAVLLGKAPNLIQIGFVENKGLREEGKKIGLPKPENYHEIVYDDTWEQEGDIHTPWRIITYSKDLNGLVNNQTISLVNPKPDPELFPKGSETEWIQPGKSFWTWLSERHQERKSDPELYKRYVDDAAELNFDFVTIDEGWYRWKSREKNQWDILSEITKKGNEKGVGIWVWKSSSERVGIPGLDDPIFRNEFFGNCTRAGVKGIKVDFFHTENPYTIDVMEAIMKDAAAHKLMLVYHGVNKPTGESRTYPNFLAKEAVRGLECVGAENTWAPGPPWTYHNTVLPFTRLLAGPADYTPVHFGKWQPKGTTTAHQLASPFVLTSPKLFLAADPEDIRESKAKELLMEMPVTWDETVVIAQSEIGKLAVFARRNDKTWFVAMLNGSDTAQFDMKLDFLSEGSTYQADIVTDALDGNEINLEKRDNVRSNESLKIDLRSGGGWLGRFSER